MIANQLQCFVRGFKSHFFRLLNYHIQELSYRILYVLLSCTLTFFILFKYKYNWLFYITTLDLFYASSYEALFSIYLFFLTLSLSFNSLYTLWQLMIFFKPAYHQKTYQKIKKGYVLCSFLTILSFGLTFELFFPFVIKLTEKLSSENINMQINITSLLNTFEIVYYFTLLGFLIPLMAQLIKIQRKYYIVFIFTFLSIFSTNEILSLFFSFLVLMLQYECSIVLYKIYFK